MADRREVLVLLAVGLAAATAGVLVGPRLGGLPEKTAIEALRSARLTDLSGHPRSLAEWSGSILVCNFWATWCPPCREEIPALVRARDKMHSSGIEFIGIAVDQAAKVSQFVQTVRISYPVLIADASAIDLVRKLGNPSGGLPFTLVLDRTGAIAHRNLGTLTQADIEAQLTALLSA